MFGSVPNNTFSTGKSVIWDNRLDKLRWINFVLILKEKKMSAPVQVTDGSFEELVVNSDTPVLVDFWAEWCGPCKMIAPILDEIANDMAGKLVIGKLDIDVNQDTAMAFGVMSIPTLLLFKNGEPVERIVGYQPKPQLVARLQPHLA